MIGNASLNLAVRSQQLVALMMTSLPLAERMLLYHVAMTAWIMLPERAGRNLASSTSRPG